MVCCIKGCNSRKEQNKKSFLHLAQMMFISWYNILYIKNIKIKKNNIICELHFKSEDINKEDIICAKKETIKFSTEDINITKNIETPISYWFANINDSCMIYKLSWFCN
ncbi:hypothetical protein ACFW04_013833 [Cataglyphis niger]